MPLQPRSRIAALLWAVSLLTVLTVACSADVEPPPSGAQLVTPRPVDPQATAPISQPPGGAAPATPVATAPTALAAAPTTSTTAAQSAAAGPAMPAPAVGNRRATVEVTFLVSNTLGKGMALRSSPVSRDPGKLWPDGTRMAGMGVEQEAYGWTWRRVRDPEGNIGWMPSNYLIQDESLPAPASSGLLQPPSAPPTQILVPTRVVAEPTPTAGPAAPTGSPAPAPAIQNAAAPPPDGLINSMHGMSSSGSGLPAGLPALFGR
jgi:hypothetical protein